MSADRVCVYCKGVPSTLACMVCGKGLDGGPVAFRVRVVAPTLKWRHEPPDWGFTDGLLADVANAADEFGGRDIEAYDSGTDDDPSARLFEFPTRAAADGFAARAKAITKSASPYVGDPEEARS